MYVSSSEAILFNSGEGTKSGKLFLRKVGNNNSRGGKAR